MIPIKQRTASHNDLVSGDLDQEAVGLLNKLAKEERSKSIAASAARQETLHNSMGNLP